MCNHTFITSPEIRLCLVQITAHYGRSDAEKPIEVKVCAKCKGVFLND